MVLKWFKKVVFSGAAATILAGSAFAKDLPDTSILMEQFKGGVIQQVQTVPVQGDFISADLLDSNQILNVSDWMPNWDGQYAFFATNNLEAAKSSLSSNSDLSGDKSSFVSDTRIPTTQKFSQNTDGNWVLDSNGVSGAYVVRFKKDSSGKFIAESLWLVVESSNKLPSGVDGHVSGKHSWFFISGDSDVQVTISTKSVEISSFHKLYEDAIQQAISDFNTEDPNSLRDFLVFLNQLEAKYKQEQQEMLLTLYTMPTPDQTLIDKLTKVSSISDFIDVLALQNVFQSYFGVITQTQITETEKILEEARSVISDGNPYNTTSTQSRAEIYGQLRGVLFSQQTDINELRAGVQGLLANSSINLTFSDANGDDSRDSLRDLIEHYFATSENMVETRIGEIRVDFEHIVVPIHHQILAQCQTNIQEILDNAKFDTQSNLTHFKGLILSEINRCDEEANKLARESGNEDLAKQIRADFDDALTEAKTILDDRISSVSITNAHRSDQVAGGFIRNRIQEIYNNLELGELQNFNLANYEPTLNGIDELYKELCVRQSTQSSEILKNAISEIEMTSYNTKQCISSLGLKAEPLYFSSLSALRDNLVDIAVMIQMSSSFVDKHDDILRKITSTVKQLNNDYSSKNMLRFTHIDEVTWKKAAQFGLDIQNLLRNIQNDGSIEKSADLNSLITISINETNEFNKFSVKLIDLGIIGGSVLLLVLLGIFGRRFRRRGTTTP